jgi:hypothetical protein
MLCTESVARLLHRNIVEFHHVGKRQESPYYELVYIKGGSLEQQHDGTPWRPSLPSMRTPNSNDPAELWRFFCRVSLSMRTSASRQFNPEPALRVNPVVIGS